MTTRERAIRALLDLADNPLDRIEYRNDQVDQIVEEVFERVVEFDDISDTGYEADLYSAVFKNSGATQRAALRAIAARIEKEEESEN